MATSDRTDTRDVIEPDDETILFEHDWTDERELGPSITNAVASFTDVPPERIGTELRRSVDFDGLDRLFSPLADGTLRESARLVVAVESCVITVHTDGWVSIERASADED